ncbi:hypothetical protein [Aureivirga sp. CE67]|uniref:hypothetical protein n=1 Tax=Aureivirga sp. CE67 TaxID=1788983 RepID=UPI0018CBBFC0|nr:hypothetical protein [Aureivirga sp. CE67]
MKKLKVILATVILSSAFMQCDKAPKQQLIPEGFSEIEIEKENSEDPIFVNSVILKDYKIIGVGEADYKGRYSWISHIQKLNPKTKKYEDIKNSDLINSESKFAEEVKVKFIAGVKQQMKANEEENMGFCEELLKELQEKEILVNELKIEPIDNSIFVSDKSNHCFPVGGAIATFSLEEFKKFLN